MGVSDVTARQPVPNCLCLSPRLLSSRRFVEGMDGREDHKASSLYGRQNHLAPRRDWRSYSEQGLGFDRPAGGG